MTLKAKVNNSYGRGNLQSTLYLDGVKICVSVIDVHATESDAEIYEEHLNELIKNGLNLTFVQRLKLRLHGVYYVLTS